MVCPEWRQDLLFFFPFCSPILLQLPSRLLFSYSFTQYLYLFLSHVVFLYLFFFLSLHHNISPSIQFLPEYFPFRFYSCVIFHPKRKIPLSDTWRSRLRLRSPIEINNIETSGRYAVYHKFFTAAICRYCIHSFSSYKFMYVYV